MAQDLEQKKGQGPLAAKRCTGPFPRPWQGPAAVVQGAASGLVGLGQKLGSRQHEGNHQGQNRVQYLAVIIHGLHCPGQLFLTDHTQFPSCIRQRLGHFAQAATRDFVNITSGIKSV